MRIAGLGYLGLSTARLGAWVEFAEQVVGMERSDSAVDGVTRLRMDDHSHRLALREASEEGTDYIGWELPSEADFDQAVTKLADLGVTTNIVTGHQALTDRQAKAYVAFSDPAGNSVEFFYGPQVDGKLVVTPHGYPFVTGNLGFGHLFIMVHEYEATWRFYEQLGFRLSDRGGDGAFRFYRCNPREHSLGLGDMDAGLGIPAGIQHMMVEYTHLDAVGMAYDRCLDGLAPLTTTWGRHVNDGMTSFYVETPGGFEIELGYGGIRVDEATWVVTEQMRDSAWGHRPTGPDGALKS